MLITCYPILNMVLNKHFPIHWLSNAFSILTSLRMFVISIILYFADFLVQCWSVIGLGVKQYTMIKRKEKKDII